MRAGRGGGSAARRSPNACHKRNFGKWANFWGVWEELVGCAVEVQADGREGSTWNVGGRLWGGGERKGRVPPVVGGSLSAWRKVGLVGRWVIGCCVDVTGTLRGSIPQPADEPLTWALSPECHTSLQVREGPGAGMALLSALGNPHAPNRSSSCAGGGPVFRGWVGKVHSGYTFRSIRAGTGGVGG